MMDERVCPVCGRSYTDVPAISRLDNATMICPDCGIRQALESLGCDLEEQDAIMEIIKAYEARKRLRVVRLTE